VTASDDGIVRSFNSSNGTEERKFEGSTGPVLAETAALQTSL